jgi:phage shock protein A
MFWRKIMNALKRWTTTLTASFDAVISQIENHDALVSGALKEAQDTGARARVQLKRVNSDGQRLRKRLAEARGNEELWSERALKSAALDEARALECLRRKKRLQHEIGELEGQLREHGKLETQLGGDLKSIEERLTRLNQQRNLLRTRQSRAEALKAVQDDGSNLFSEIDGIFERWETKVSQYECQAGCLGEQSDDLEKDFVSQEEEGELRAALSDLLQQASPPKIEGAPK